MTVHPEIEEIFTTRELWSSFIGYTELTETKPSLGGLVMVNAEFPQREL